MGTDAAEKIDTQCEPATEQQLSTQEPPVKKIKLISEITESAMSTSVKKESVFDKVFGDVYITAVEPAKPPLVLAENEVQPYKECPPVPLGVNPLQWWKDHEPRFPLLAQVVKKYLCIPATSVPSERVFSTAGDILNAQRSRLKAKHVDYVNFLEKEYVLNDT